MGDPHFDGGVGQPVLDGLICAGHRHFDHFGALVAHDGERRIEPRHDDRIDADGRVSAIDADAQPTHAFFHDGEVIRHLVKFGGRIVFVAAGHGAEHRREVGDAAGHRPDMVERRRIVEHTVA